MADNPARRGPILLASDASGQSAAPVIVARSLADRLGLPLEVVTVLEPQVMYGVALGGLPVSLPELDEAQRRDRADAVQNFVARFSGGAPPTPVHVRFGGIADEIATVARERAATVVIVGAAPHHRLNRIIGGERAVQVLRSLACPVLSVPPGFTSLPRNIVVGMDFAPASVRAAQIALVMLAEGGTLTLLHTMSPLLADASLRDSAGRDPADAVQSLFDRVRDELRPYLPAHATIETCVKTAGAVEGIVSAASTLGADLIAVGTHGPRMLERLFVGSVASSVVHAAPQAVLAVPPPSPADALELSLRISGTAATAHPRDWKQALAGFTTRNAHCRVTVEIDDPALGAQMLGRGLALNGVTYDPHDQRVEIMLGDSVNPMRHLMHSIPDVESIAMTADHFGHEVLELRHGHGHTLVTRDA